MLVGFFFLNKFLPEIALEITWTRNFTFIFDCFIKKNKLFGRKESRHDVFLHL